MSRSSRQACTVSRFYSDLGIRLHSLTGENIRQSEKFDLEGCFALGSFDVAYRFEMVCFFLLFC